MKIPFVDLKAQYIDLKIEMDNAIQQVIDERAFIGNTNNRFVSKFEQEFAEFAGADHCVSCANGTDAIEILLKASGVKTGDEVIVPAISWIATSEAVSNIGATPVFADIEEGSFTICPQSVRSKITDQTRAIIPVHLYGCPADLTSISELCLDHDLILIEDCAQAHGAHYKGKPVGTFGSGGTFSFFPGKNLGAYGDAGGIITMDSEIAATAKMISQHGQSSKKHDHKMEGRNSRLDGIQAAILSVKLPHLPKWTDRRIHNALRYSEQLESLDLCLQQSDSQNKHVYHLFAVLHEQRDHLRKELQAAGISTGNQYPKPLPFLSAYRHKKTKIEDFPNAIRLSEQILTLPMHPEMDAAKTGYVCSNLSKAISQLK